MAVKVACLLAPDELGARVVGLTRRAEGELPPVRSRCDAVETKIDLLRHRSAMRAVLTAVRWLLRSGPTPADDQPSEQAARILAGAASPRNALFRRPESHF